MKIEKGICMRRFVLPQTAMNCSLVFASVALIISFWFFVRYETVWKVHRAVIASSAKQSLSSFLLTLRLLRHLRILAMTPTSTFQIVSKEG